MSRDEEIVRVARAALDSFPEDPRLWSWLGCAYQTLGQHADALRACEQGCSLPGATGFPHRIRASALSALNRHADALAAARAAVSVEPECSLAHTQLARMAREMGELDVEARALEAALELDPQSVDVHQRAGISARDRGELAASRVHLERALALDPSSAHVHHSLGETALERGDYTEAVEAFRRALACDPRVPGFHCSLGYALIDADRKAEAIDVFDAGVLAFPDDLDFVQGKLYALHQSQRFEEMREVVRACVAEHPDNAEAWSFFAWCQNNIETLDEAVAAARRAVALDGSPENHETLARMLHTARRYTESLAAAEQAVELAPGSVKHWDALFWAHHALGDVAGAARAGEQMIALAPQKAQGYLALVRLEVARADRSAARIARAAQRLIEQLPQEPDTWSHLGSHYFVLGDRDAIAHCESKLRELLARDVLSEVGTDEAERGVHEMQAYMRYLDSDLTGARESMLNSCEDGAPDDCSQVCFLGLLAVREDDLELARRLQRHERWGARRGRRCLDPICAYGLMLDDALSGH